MFLRPRYADRRAMRNARFRASIGVSFQLYQIPLELESLSLRHGFQCSSMQSGEDSTSPLWAPQPNSAFVTLDSPSLTSPSQHTGNVVPQ